MDRNILIGKIFKALYIYEDSVSLCSDDYCKYISKLWVLLAGLEDEDIKRDALPIIKGLKTLGMEVDHNTVKSSIFKIISMVKKEV